jgi:hypothetical protein
MKRRASMKRRIPSYRTIAPRMTWGPIRRTIATAPAPTGKTTYRSTTLPEQTGNTCTGIPIPSSGSAALVRCGGR